MIQAILALATAGVLMGAEAPELLAPYKKASDCLVDAAKLNNQNADKLKEHGAVFICLKVELPSV